MVLCVRRRNARPDADWGIDRSPVHQSRAQGCHCGAPHFGLGARAMIGERARRFAPNGSVKRRPQATKLRERKARTPARRANTLANRPRRSARGLPRPAAQLKRLRWRRHLPRVPDSKRCGPSPKRCGPSSQGQEASSRRRGCRPEALGPATMPADGRHEARGMQIESLRPVRRLRKSRCGPRHWTPTAPSGAGPGRPVRHVPAGSPPRHQARCGQRAPSSRPVRRRRPIVRLARAALWDGRSGRPPRSIEVESGPADCGTQTTIGVGNRQSPMAGKWKRLEKDAPRLRQRPRHPRGQGASTPEQESSAISDRHGCRSTSRRRIRSILRVLPAELARIAGGVE